MGPEQPPSSGGGQGRGQEGAQVASVGHEMLLLLLLGFFSRAMGSRGVFLSGEGTDRHESAGLGNYPVEAAAASPLHRERVEDRQAI